MRNGLRIPALRYALLAILGLVIGVNLYSFNASSLMGNRLPMPFGYGAAVVLSGSMEPELSTGDLVIVVETDSVEVGDVIVYQDGGMLVVHRVVGLDGELITTKGDANNVADQPINAAAVKGEVVASVPMLGRLVSFLKSPLGMALAILGAIALLEAPRWAERRRDEEERRAIAAEIEKLRRELRR